MSVPAPRRECRCRVARSGARGFRACQRCISTASRRQPGRAQNLRDSADIEAQQRFAPSRGPRERAQLSPFISNESSKRRPRLTKQYAVIRFEVPPHCGARRHPAVYDAGFGSSSRVYEQVDTRLGATPPVPLGRPRRADLPRINHRLDSRRSAPRDRSLFRAVRRRQNAAARGAEARVPGEPDRADSGSHSRNSSNGSHRSIATSPGAEHDLPLDVRHTAFQCAWKYSIVPYGEVRSYGEVAEGIAEPGAARAVARACATNVVAVVIPCHRVIRASGELGGYRWGLDRKRTLIDMERAASSS